MMSEAELLAQIMQRPAPERARIASAVIRSLDDGEDADADDAWDAELVRRMKEIDDGTAQSIPLEEFEAHMRETRAALAAARTKRG